MSNLLFPEDTEPAGCPPRPKTPPNLKNKKGRAAASLASAKMSGRKYFYLIIGYYLATVYIRTVLSESVTDFTNEIPPKDDEGHDGHDGHGEAGHGGIHITVVDFEGVETPFIIALWIFCASLAKIGFHMAPKLSHIFPESCLLIVVGVVIGLLLFHTNSVHVSPLTPKTFFLYMLPPIILDAGYFMPNRLFFNNLGTILLFAVVGTLWNTFTIGLSLWGLGQFDLYGVDLPLLQTLLFSALISAVDPVAVLAVFEEIHVNEVLYIVVFGESLLNDAVTVVLYHMFDAYAKMGADKVTPVEILKGIASFPVVSLGGTAIGVIFGFLTGFVTRFTNHVRVIEPIFIFIIAYLAYLCAETFHMSGILAITFCGITMKNYVEANISQKSHTTVKYAMKMLSSSSETIIFMFLGVSTIHDDHEWNWWFIAMTILFCSFYRIMGVIIFTSMANRFRLHKLGKVDQFVMSYGGLRGAVAFALVLLIEKEAVNCNEKLQKMFITTTITMVYFTVFVQGITIKPLVEWLKVKRSDKRKMTMNERIHGRMIDHAMASLESLLGQVGHYNLRNKFKQFDNAYIRPCLIRDLKGAEPKILETYSRITMEEAMEQMNRNPSGKLSAESMAQLLRSYDSTSNMNNRSGSIDPLNFDFQELQYRGNKKDFSDAKIHHLLAEELYKPNRRYRRLSYSRHAVNEQDLGTEIQPQLNYKMQMNFRKMVSDKAHKRVRKSGVGGINKNPSNGTGPGPYEEYDNPAFTIESENYQGQGNEIYFITGGKTGGSIQGDFHRDWNERRWSQASVDSTKSYMEPAYPHTAHPIHRHGRRHSSIFYDDSPTLTEVTLPWRRTEGQQTADLNGNFPPQNPLQQIPLSRFRVTPIRRLSSRRDDDGPTTTERTLPWKRDDDTEEGANGEATGLKQSEFPAWSMNKEYLAYNSPTNTFLGGIESNRAKTPTVIGLFKRDSIGGSPRRGSISSRLDSPRHSIVSEGSTSSLNGGTGSLTPGAGAGVHGDFDTASIPQLLSLRRGSQFLSLSIPEVGEDEDEEEHVEVIDEKDEDDYVDEDDHDHDHNEPSNSRFMVKNLASNSKETTLQTSTSTKPTESKEESKVQVVVVDDKGILRIKNEEKMAEKSPNSDDEDHDHDESRERTRF